MDYLAYGSNLHPARLSRRCPSAQLLGVIQLENHALFFHKRGADGSAKCNLARQNGSMAYAAHYFLPAVEKPVLDQYEGLGHGYEMYPVTFPCGSAARQGFFYQAQDGYVDTSLFPFDWYRELVVLGARYLKFPANYIRVIEDTPVVADCDQARREENLALAKEIKDSNLKDPQEKERHDDC